MKTTIRIGTMALLVSALGTTAASPKDDVLAAAKQLANKSNYSWKTTVQTPDAGGGGRFRTGPTDGKTEKDGFTCLSMTRGDNTIEAAFKGDKAALKTADGWQTLAEAAESSGGQPGPGRFMARMLQSFKVPAAQAADLAGKTKEITQSGDACGGDLTEEGAKALLTFGPRPGGGEGPTVTNPKGSVKFWIKDGALSKYEFKVQGTVTFNNNDMNVDRTTTVEIKDIGSTKVEVPDDAKKKLS